MERKDQNKWWFKEATKEFREELLGIDRVTRVTAWGRQLRFRASVVIWDNKGQVGLGIGKAWEVVVAIEKAVRDAKKNLVKFQITEGTIAHDVTSKFKAARIMIHPASQGTGIIAWGAVRKIISVSGIKDIIAKRYGCTNGITNARATLKALVMLKKVEPKKTKSTEFKSVEAPVLEVKEEVKVTKVEAPKEIKVEAPVVKKAAPAKKPAAKKTK